MLGFMDMDIFKELLNSPSEAKVRNNIISEIRTGNISSDLEKCLVTYNKIEHHVDELQKQNRGTDALLERGIELFKEGKIILLDGELTSYDMYKLPPFLMFIPFPGRLLFNINGMKKTNWKKVGNNEYEYSFSNFRIELKFILVTAYIMYEMLVNKREKDFINDKKLMQLVSQIYVEFFKKAIGRLGSGIDEVETLNYIITKFFYIHSLGMPEDEADKIISNSLGYLDYQMSYIRLQEESIDYSRMDTFILTMSKHLYRKEIDIKQLVVAWINSFGHSIFTEMEYFPALLTHLLVLIFNVDFVNQRYDLRSGRDAIYQRLTIILK